MTRKGFTLIELLVVIAILSLLASLMLPALSLSKSRAKSIKCLNNLKQMVIAAQIYTAESNDYYPLSYYYQDSQDGISYSFAWDLTTVIGAERKVVPGLLWQGRGIKAVQQCPAYLGDANWQKNPYTGYNYNTSYIGRGQFEAIPESAKDSSVRVPSQTVIFGDGEYSAGANKFMRAPWESPGDASFKGRWAGTQGFRHSGHSNAAFCDGHAESLKNRFTENQDGSQLVAPGTGFLSSDNSLYDLE